jgi:fermentation-respiration switch protein FrsA (DUF1100 family)
MKTTKLIPLSLVASAVLGTTSVAAETFLGADYHDGKNKVAFLSENVRIAGNVFLPPNYDENKNYPALVLITPASGVKEQTAGHYAEKMAKKRLYYPSF